ncbi:hypothetical protein RW092_20585 [Paenibacillus sp. 3LSP]|uniref:hypothetical protein n=1 Tax=Paenibacillus sp. 3LSP TaxID=2800795 RepID=UPI0028FDABB7|nr:hypothetical protein [Paenibacillus sp. 3LSP]MDU0332572.1 hypothetical protein [Paenibacillus sp. 3LSP]
MSDQILNQILDKLNEMNSRIGSIESGQAELQHIIRAIRDRQEESDAKLEALSMDVHRLNGTVEAIKEDLSELKEGQQRQDKILESLAVRSLEQETDIRRLKAN